MESYSFGVICICILVLSLSSITKQIEKTLLCNVDPAIPVGWHYHPHSSPSQTNNKCQASLGLIGDVTDVINGVVTEQTENTFWSKENAGSFGFGAGAIGPLAGLGEAIFANGIAIVRSTDNGSANYFQTVTSPTFRTPFSLFVQDGAQPDATIRVNLPSSNFSLTNIYDYLYIKVNSAPFCFYGLAQFTQLEGIAVSKAPIYEEPLFGKISEGYYTQPGFHLPNQHGMLFGCAANFSELRDPELFRMLSKLLYVNPHDNSKNFTSSVLNVHAHAVSMKKCLRSPDQIDFSSVQDVFHLLSNATMTFVDASVFILNNKDKLVEMFPVHNNEIPGSLNLDHPQSQPDRSCSMGVKFMPELFIISILTVILMHSY